MPPNRVCINAFLPGRLPFSVRTVYFLFLQLTSYLLSYLINYPIQPMTSSLYVSYSILLHLSSLVLWHRYDLTKYWLPHCFLSDISGLCAEYLHIQYIQYILSGGIPVQNIWDICQVRYYYDSHMITYTDLYISGISASSVTFLAFALFHSHARDRAL
jgi:hypothetical protein